MPLDVVGKLKNVCNRFEKLRETKQICLLTEKKKPVQQYYIYVLEMSIWAQTIFEFIIATCKTFLLTPTFCVRPFHSFFASIIRFPFLIWPNRTSRSISSNFLVFFEIKRFYFLLFLFYFHTISLAEIFCLVTWTYLI